MTSGQEAHRSEGVSMARDRIRKKTTQYLIPLTHEEIENLQKELHKLDQVKCHTLIWSVNNHMKQSVGSTYI